MNEQYCNLLIMEVTELDMIRAIGQWEPEDKIYRLHCPEIPEDSKLLRVWHSNESRSYKYLFYHPDFEEVPDGVIPPSVQSRILNVKISGV